MKEKILITLLVIALVSGCSSFSIPGVSGISAGTNVAGGSGLVMTGFSADPTTAYSGNTVRVIMDVQNLGGTTVLKSDTHSFVYLTGSNMNLGSTDTTYWRGQAAADKLSCRSFTRDMTAPDVVRGTDGALSTIKWNLLAPGLTPGQTRTDSIIGRVYTDYETALNGNIWIYQESEADAAKASSRVLSTSSFTSTSGPVLVQATLSPDPIIIYGSDKTTTLTIRISNLASGTIYKAGKETCGANGPSTIPTADLNKVDVSITANDFDGYTDCTGEAELVSGRPTTMVCDLSVKSAVQTFNSFPIKISVKYGYFTESTASVVVQGKSSTSASTGA